MIRFDADFENASLGQVSQLSHNWYHIGLRPDTAYWTHFRIRGCKDKEITFNLTFVPRPPSNRWGTFDTGDPENPDTRCRNPYLSYDGQTWEHFFFAQRFVTMPNTVCFRHTFEEDEAYVCYTIPYTYTDLRNYLQTIEANPRVTVESIGRTTQGHDQPLISISGSEAARDLIVLVCREDSDEPTSNCALEGLIDHLIQGDDPGIREMLERVAFKIVPMVSIDAVISGSPYGGPYDVMARRWMDERPLPEIQNVRSLLGEWFERYQILLIGKLHGGQTYDNPPVWDFRVFELDLRRCLPKKRPPPDQLDPIWNPFLRDAVPWVRKLSILESYLQTEYDFWNFFSVHTNGRDPANLRQQGALFADLLARYVKIRQI